MRLKNNKAFSLIEILMVVTIIVVLTSMVAPNFTKRTKQARISVAKVDIEANIAQALDTYEMDNGRYPSTEQGLRALVFESTIDPIPLNWNGPYLKKKRVPLDPWKKPYVYECPGTHNEENYDLMSYGPDGIESSDDIKNWYDRNIQ